jgi:ketosteroid isomerase-like protein
VSENLDLVRSIYADWERGDFSRVDWADPEIEYVGVGGPNPGTWTGPSEIKEGWRTFLTPWEEFHTKAGDYRESDDGRVLVLGAVGARGKASGLDLRAQVASLFQIRAGKVVRLVLYWDPKQALADLGREE